MSEFIVNLKGYSNLSKKENKLIVVLIYKDKAGHAFVNRKDFENNRDFQNCICSDLLSQL